MTLLPEKCPFCTGTAFPKQKAITVIHIRKAFGLTQHYYQCKKCESIYTTLLTDTLTLQQLPKPYVKNLEGYPRNKIDQIIQEWARWPKNTEFSTPQMIYPVIERLNREISFHAEYYLPELKPRFKISIIDPAIGPISTIYGNFMTETWCHTAATAITWLENKKQITAVTEEQPDTTPEAP